MLTDSGGSTKPVRKAPQLPVAFAMAFERIVVDSSSPKFLRMFAWFRLVRLWACLRFDDHRGLLPQSMRLVSGCLKGTLVRTKTSGPGRRREELYIHVDSAAYLVSPGWLEAGVEPVG